MRRKMPQAPTDYCTEGRFRFDPLRTDIVLRRVHQRSVWDDAYRTGERCFREILRAGANPARILFGHLVFLLGSWLYELRDWPRRSALNLQIALRTRPIRFSR